MSVLKRFCLTDARLRDADLELCRCHGGADVSTVDYYGQKNICLTDGEGEQ